ncbi:hypothetical protein [Streptomyces sp. NPDC051909]|uniref:hypothetical protein n=1 Tax=Streptomyces sp. NPDC051909 TaxID=3154944 RepID=UPI0034411F93
MSHRDNSVFVDTSGRRRRAARWAAVGIGAGCLGFLGIVVAGVFGSGPAGGPLNWQDDEPPAPPALIQADPGDDGADDEKSDGPSGSPSGTPSGKATATASTAPSASASKTASAPSASSTTRAPAPDPTDGTVTGPGNSGNAPGSTKKPK